jgi:hypothetical protein
MLCKGLCGRSTATLVYCKQQCQCSPSGVAECASCLPGCRQCCVQDSSCTGAACAAPAAALPVSYVGYSRVELTYTWNVCWMVRALRVVGLHSVGAPLCCTQATLVHRLEVSDLQHGSGCFAVRSHTCSMVLGGLHCAHLWTWCCHAGHGHLLQPTPEVATLLPPSALHCLCMLCTVCAWGGLGDCSSLNQNTTPVPVCN